ncbi:vWA domain-containing protein [Microscilla marina]|uniref:von Willebrand factor type A domain protein n=1 Tax=Microscilla marina ATCC 23134 TaxID=313606 RepID=A1ZRP2_MICM2|nr:VWA domain-containing protein [Microscilla marina]EAY26947.1 von Willebrand factor type A domain protein [Microscilla marina ATCC 23134]
MKAFILSLVLASGIILPSFGQLSPERQKTLNRYLQFSDQVSKEAKTMLRCLSSHYRKVQRYKRMQRVYYNIRAPFCQKRSSLLKDKYNKALRGGIAGLNAEAKAVYRIFDKFAALESDLKQYYVSKSYQKDKFAHNDEVITAYEKLFAQLQTQSQRLQNQVLRMGKQTYKASDPHHRVERKMRELLRAEDRFQQKIAFSLETISPQANVNEALLKESVQTLEKHLKALPTINEAPIRGFAIMSYTSFLRAANSLLESRRKLWDQSTITYKNSRYRSSYYSSRYSVYSYFKQYVDNCRRNQVYFLYHSQVAPRFSTQALPTPKNGNIPPKTNTFQKKPVPPLPLLSHNQPISLKVLSALNNYVECINHSINRNNRLVSTIVRHDKTVKRIEAQKKEQADNKKLPVNPRTKRPRKKYIYYPRYFTRNYYYPKSLFYKVQQGSQKLPQAYQLVLNAQMQNIQNILEEMVGLGYQLNEYLKKRGYQTDQFAKSKQILKRYQYLFDIFDAQRNGLQANIQQIKNAYPINKNALPPSRAQQMLNKALTLGEPIMLAAKGFMQKKSQALLKQTMATPLISEFADVKIDYSRKNRRLKRNWRSVKSFVQATESIAHAQGKYRVSAQTIQGLYYKYNTLIKKFNQSIKVVIQPTLKKMLYPKVLSFEKVGYTPCDCGDANEVVNMNSMQGFAHNNLMLLLDVSGSMKNELPMLKSALKYLVNIMRPEDKVSVVVFGSEAKLMLRPTSAKYKAQIMQAIDTLKSSGRTNGEAGLKLAYQWIQNNYKNNNNNRIILASDGEFSISKGLYQMIEQKAEESIALSVFSFADQLKAYKKLKKLVSLGKGNLEAVAQGNITYKMVREAQSKRLPGKRIRKSTTTSTKKPCDCDSYKIKQLPPPKIVIKTDTNYQGVNMTSMKGFAHNNLMLLLDVSGSMSSKDKLPLLKESFKYLISIMRPQDDVSIVIYAGDAAIVLKPTSASNQEQINAVIDKLRSRGKTNVKAGFKLAYKWMSKNFKEGGNNRIILATDGEFPISKYIYKLVEKRATKGINLSVFSFGSMTKKFETLEKLVAKGKGNYEQVNARNVKYKLVKEAQSKRVE